MDLSRSVSEMNSDFCRKSQIFPTFVYLTPPLREFPLVFCNGDRTQNKTSHVPARWWKEFHDMCIRFDTIPECDGQTDLS